MGVVDLLCDCCGLTVRQRRLGEPDAGLRPGLCGRCVDHLPAAGEPVTAALARAEDHLARWRAEADRAHHRAAKHQGAAELAHRSRDELYETLLHVSDLHRPLGLRCLCGVKNCATLSVVDHRLHGWRDATVDADLRAAERAAWRG